ncbi:16S rRNA (uracil(1498)-N(3))-methyltransferase [Arcticibacter sp. MXS-1]|uniref:16S rRNA (uracil(1498)-N(3))-methyltransferase n=1 Tax=Arcticibacter sp. MXS-1 TaxID=3341726 RepID=UPI0035A8F815
MHLFYTPDISGATYTLSEEESRHCVKVLRLNVGETVYLVDGRGGFYTAMLADADARRAVLNIVEHQEEYGKRSHYLHIGIAPTKNIERFEWFLEKATEIGIDEISPIICDRSERREIKTARLNKIITAAVKQSLKAYHPLLNEPVHLREFLLRNKSKMQTFMAHCMEGDKLPLKSVLRLSHPCTILIGPEGDFTPAELKMALDTGAEAISLGTARLRTETAGLEACFEVNFLNR